MTHLLISSFILFSTETFLVAPQGISQFSNQPRNCTVSNLKIFILQFFCQLASGFAGPLQSADRVTGRRILQNLFQRLQESGLFFSTAMPSTTLATNPGSWIAPGMIHFLLPSINRVPAQTCDLRQLGNIASLTCQHTDESSSVPFIQSQQNTIDRFMLFGNFAVRMSLASLTGAVMKLSFLSSPLCLSQFVLGRSLSQVFKLFLDKS